MPSATGFFSQKTITTTTTTTKTVPRPRSSGDPSNVQLYSGSSSSYNNRQQNGAPVPEPRANKMVSNNEMNRILSDVRKDQNKNVVLDTLAALVTDCNATAQVLRSRSSSRTNLNDEGRESRLIYQLTEDEDYKNAYRRSTSAPRSTSPPSDYGANRGKYLPGAVKVLPDTAGSGFRSQTGEAEYTLKLHSPIYRSDGPDVDSSRPKATMPDDKSPSLEKICRDFDIDAPARQRSVSRPRSETPVSRKLIVLEEPKDYEAPICAACHQSIHGPCITALAPNSKRAQKYHPPHFVCNYCLKPLNLKGTYREHELKPYCHECFYRLFSGHIYVTENKISLNI